MSTPILGMPELVIGQAIPETTVNEIARILEPCSRSLAFSIYTRTMLRRAIAASHPARLRLRDLIALPLMRGSDMSRTLIVLTLIVGTGAIAFAICEYLARRPK